MLLFSAARGGGNFSHFAHLICDFILPFHSYLRATGLFELLLEGRRIVLELRDTVPMKFGPLLPIVREVFPGLEVEYSARFSAPPVFLRRRAWHNKPEDLEYFVQHLRQVLPIKESHHGVILVQRGESRKSYPGGNFFLRSGADRRTIGSGFEKLVERVKEIRPDAIPVVLEEMSFAEQVSLFLGADMLIAQHGAAFAHAHWMPMGGHLIELQGRGARLCANFMPTVAQLRNHRASVVYYPVKRTDGTWILSIGDATKVTRLLARTEKL